MVRIVMKDKGMRRIHSAVFGLFLLLVTGGIAAAQSGGSVWLGTASMSRFGEFPATGLYAASNSFPRNTIVTVENLQNGKTARVIVADRLNNPGLFILLSREAAGALGITQDETVQVRVSMESERDGIAESLVEERPYSVDPEVNPAVLTENYELPEEETTETGAAEETEEAEAAEETEEAEEEPLPDDTPRLTSAIMSPEPREPVFPSLALPEEPAEPVIAETEIPETEERGEEAPVLTAMEESPGYADFRLPDLAIPSEPELSAAAEEDAGEPEEETPELTALETSPEIPGLNLTSIAVPPEPVEEAAEEEEAPAGDARLSSMTQPSPDVDPLVLWDLDVPEGPGKTVIAEEDETPAMVDVPGSPFVEPLVVASLEEPMDPADLVDTGTVETAETEEEPEDTTPEITDLLDTPDPDRLALSDVAVPEEPNAEEGEVPEALGVDSETPERIAEVDLESIDEPLEPSEMEEAIETAEKEPVEETETEESPMVAEISEGKLTVEIPEDTMLVLEPAEPRPPEDTTPEALEVPGSEIEGDGGTEGIEEPEVYPEPPGEESAAPLVAEAETEGMGKETKSETEITAGSLEKGAYYVQLGVYSESGNAKSIADKYSGSYPVAVLRETSASKNIYKVLLGPVNYDESGGLLFNFRAKGFKDAFIRRE